MGLNDTVSAERVHIGFFGMRNAGKSSLVNAVTGQQLSVVSDVKGTTTDPVKKAMELLPLGPVVIIDTPGLDDEGELGNLRVQKAKQILGQTDIAVLVVDSTAGMSLQDRELVDEFAERKIPYVVVYNKADLASGKDSDAECQQVNIGADCQQINASVEYQQENIDAECQQINAEAECQQVNTEADCQQINASVEYQQVNIDSERQQINADAECQQKDIDTLHVANTDQKVFRVSSVTGEGIHTLKEALGSFAQNRKKEKALVSDLVEAGDLVVLVTPIDESAPKGRLILPQQLTIRDILDAHGIVVTCQATELKQTLAGLAKKPKMVITDSQAFATVSRETPKDIPLTSFSILMARYKGDLKELVYGAAALTKLQEGDNVLISEGCTHHRQCNDIGTVKLPNWITEFTGVQPEFTFTSGSEFPDDLSKYSVIVHCGGCMLNEAEMKHRIKRAADAGVPIVNYGIAIAQMQGILKRSVALFEHIAELLE